MNNKRLTLKVDFLTNFVLNRAKTVDTLDSALVTAQAINAWNIIEECINKDLEEDTSK